MSQPTGDQQYPTNEGRIARSWRLTVASWAVVRGDRALLALAAIAGLTGVAGVALIFLLGGSVSNGHGRGGGIGLAALILAYPLMFVSVFFNTAIAAAAAAALEGRHLSLGEALAVPMRRLPQVALWALIASLVGFVLEQLISRLPLGGSIVARIVGVGWSLASLFAIPVLALEDCSAPQCLRRSAQVIKSRWGESVSGVIMIGAWVFLAVLVLGIAFAIAAALTVGQPVLFVAVVVLGALTLLAIVALQAVVRQTFAVALYRYATTNAPQGHFEERDLSSPFGKRGFFR